MIHHHVDFTDLYDLANRTQSGILKYNLLKENKEWYLKELDTWEYKGTSNQRDNWIRWNYLKTLEFRCANMTFDYEVMVKRIIHANDITQRLKEDLIRLNPDLELVRLQEEMKKANSIPINNISNLTTNEATVKIKSRTIKL